MNGDSTEVVKLLSEKIDSNGKQFKQRFDDFQKYMDDKYGGQQTQIDNHCGRIRGLEKYKNTAGGVIIIIVFIISSWTIFKSVL